MPNFICSLNWAIQAIWVLRAAEGVLVIVNFVNKREHEEFLECK